MNDYLNDTAGTLSAREKGLFILFTGLYMLGFFVFFQPFGINNYDPQERITPLFFAMVVVFSVATMVLMAINEFLLFPLMLRQPRRWQIGLWILWSLLFVSSGIFLLYNWLGSWHDLHWSSYGEFIINISVLALFPLAGLGFYLKYRSLSQTLDMEISRHTISGTPGASMITFVAENGKDRLVLPLDTIGFITSDDNYVTIHTLEEGHWREQLFRKSLKSIQEENLHPDLLRCHRSFMVNAGNVVRISGNTRQLAIFLEGRDAPIPVSRQYAETIMAVFAP